MNKTHFKAGDLFVFIKERTYKLQVLIITEPKSRVRGPQNHDCFLLYHVGENQQWTSFCELSMIKSWIAIYGDCLIIVSPDNLTSEMKV